MEPELTSLFAILSLVACQYTAYIVPVYYSGIGPIRVADLTCYVATTGRVPWESSSMAFLIEAQRKPGPLTKSWTLVRR
jgi:hypothetical protein